MQDAEEKNSLNAKPVSREFWNRIRLCPTVVFKNIRRLNLTVHPPLGVVRISAPLRMGMETILAFANSRLEWVRRQQKRARRRRDARVAVR